MREMRAQEFFNFKPLSTPADLTVTCSLSSKSDLT